MNNTKYVGVQLDASLVEDMDEYRNQLAAEEKRHISRTELITELIKERLSKEFWTQKE